MCWGFIYCIRFRHGEVIKPMRPNYKTMWVYLKVGNWRTSSHWVFFLQCTCNTEAQSQLRWHFVAWVENSLRLKFNTSTATQLRRVGWWFDMMTRVNLSEDFHFYFSWRPLPNELQRRVWEGWKFWIWNDGLSDQWTWVQHLCWRESWYSGINCEAAINPST